MNDVTASEVLGRCYGIDTADWSTWWTIDAYAFANGIHSPALERGVKAAEKQRMPSNASIKAAREVVNHACAVLGLAEAYR